MRVCKVQMGMKSCTKYILAINKQRFLSQKIVRNKKHYNYFDKLAIICILLKFSPTTLLIEMPKKKTKNYKFDSVDLLINLEKNVTSTCVCVCV